MNKKGATQTIITGTITKQANNQNIHKRTIIINNTQ